MGRKARKSTVWFTADQHFGHKNILRYCQRPFSCVSDMNHDIIDRWNSVVSPKDAVYCLGDFTLETYAQQYFTQLQGRIHVVPGGHDRRWLRKGSAYSASSQRVKILPSLYTLTVEKQAIVLCHYAMRVWDRSHYGAWQLHGHSHGQLLPIGNQLDVGVDARDFSPISLEEVKELIGI